MIDYFYKKDIEHETYIRLYTKLKNSIGKFEEYDSNAKIAGIYYIYNDNNELMYIGQSKNIASRLTTHIRGKYRNSSKIVIEPCDALELNNIERFLIDTLKPIDNIMVNEKYCIEDTYWSEMFLEIGENKKEFLDFSDIGNHVFSSPRTTVYPSLGTVVSADLVPELHAMLSTVEEIDPTIVDKVLNHIRGVK